MKKGNKTTKGKPKSTAAKGKGVRELTEKDLEQVQGGFQTGGSGSRIHADWEYKGF